MEPNSHLLCLLACPECRESLEFTQYPCGDSKNTNSIFGTLKCSCYEYPVVDSVPILIQKQVAQFAFGTGDIDSEGTEPTYLVQQIKNGKGKDALLECLSFTPSFSWMQNLPIWRLWNKGIIPKLGRKWIKNKIKKLIDSNSKDTLEDWLELFFAYMPGSNHELLHYYKHRFVLPRTLATYSILELLDFSDKPILDIACGIGPFPYFVTSQNPNTQLIGFDFNFYLAWWQRRFMAPNQLFLCADGGNPLPFKDDTFGSIYCSDSFMFIPNKKQFVEECQRCAPGRPIALTRVGNRDAYPKNWGQESNAQEYANLLGAETLTFRESDLVRCYLDRENPLVSANCKPSELTHDKWIYLIKNAGQKSLDLPAKYPHELGQPTLNPIFRVQTTNNNMIFNFTFPSVWFAYQNADMLSYHGDKTEVEKDHLIKHLSDSNSDEFKDLIKKFIIIGLPKRYLRSAEH